MGNWTISKRLSVALSAIVLVTIALGSYAFVQLRSLSHTTTTITADALPGVVTMGEVEALVVESQQFIVWHIASDDQKEIATLEAGLKADADEITRQLAEYDKTIVRADDRQLFDAIKPARAEYVHVRDEVVLPLSRALKNAEALNAYRTQLKPAYEKYRATISAAFDNNKKFGETQSTTVTDDASAANMNIVIGLIAATVLGATVGFLIVRSTNAVLRASVSALSDGAQQVASASGQVASSAQSLSQGSTTQAASLEETSASMEEMSSMTRKNAENSQQAAAMMAETERLVNGANGALSEMVHSMAAIKESSDKVGKIIKTIDEIAFQTNILALNAAVEAARAGEAGMGFAVVADEVRALAQRSAQAAKDTAGLIEESIVRSTEGQAKVQVVGGAIEQITSSTVKVKGLVDEVSEASRQQAQGFDQVSQAIAQMEKVTQGTAATAEESAAASEELSAQAETSMQVVAQLSALVGGGGARTADAPDAVRKPAAKTAVAKGTVLPMRRKAGAAATQTPEEQIPLGDTGTYGSF